MALSIVPIVFASVAGILLVRKRRQLSDITHCVQRCVEALRFDEFKVKFPKIPQSPVMLSIFEPFEELFTGAGVLRLLHHGHQIGSPFYKLIECTFASMDSYSDFGLEILQFPENSGRRSSISPTLSMAVAVSRAYDAAHMVLKVRQASGRRFSS